MEENITYYGCCETCGKYYKVMVEDNPTEHLFCPHCGEATQNWNTEGFLDYTQ